MPHSGPFIVRALLPSCPLALLPSCPLALLPCCLSASATRLFAGGRLPLRAILYIGPLAPIFSPPVPALRSEHEDIAPMPKTPVRSRYFPSPYAHLLFDARL